MTKIGVSHKKTASGYVSESVKYQASNCKDCPLRCLCYKSKQDKRTIEVNHRLNTYKKKACELLTSEEGIRHRGQRCIEPEAVFGQEKWNMGYRRFRHFGKDKITMDFAFFVIAFNIKKLYAKIAKSTKNGENNPFIGRFLFIISFVIYKYLISYDFVKFITKNLPIIEKRDYVLNRILTQPHFFLFARCSERDTIGGSC